MPNRREFLRHAAAASAGVFCVACGLRRAAAQGGPGAAKRREVTVGGKRVRTVDMHCHCAVPEVLDLVKGTDMERAVRGQLEGRLGFPVGAERLADMDADGIDLQVMSINAYWYGAPRDLARRIIDVQNEKLAQLTKANPERFAAYASVALQYPELAAEQLEHAMKQLGLRGAAIGGSVEGEELSAPRFDPFWAKAEELQAPIFIHPQNSADATGVRKRVQGSGALANVIGNPLETSIALAHLIFEGTLDRFPGLKICAAHGGGFLPSYANRSDAVITTFPNRVGPLPKKKPTQYLKDGQLYFDSIMFTGEAMRHLIAESGVGQIMVGTDYPFPWNKVPVDHILSIPGLSDDDRIAILGGTAAKLLGIAN